MKYTHKGIQVTEYNTQHRQPYAHVVIDGHAELSDWNIYLDCKIDLELSDIPDDPRCVNAQLILNDGDYESRLMVMSTSQLVKNINRNDALLDDIAETLAHYMVEEIMG